MNKEDKKEYSKKYYWKNHEKMKEYQRLRSKDPKVKAKSKRYNKKPSVKKRVRAYRKEYFQRPGVKERYNKNRREYMRYYRYKKVYDNNCKEVKKMSSKLEVGEKYLVIVLWNLIRIPCFPVKDKKNPNEPDYRGEGVGIYVNAKKGESTTPKIEVQKF